MLSTTSYLSLSRSLRRYPSAAQGHLRAIHPISRFTPYHPSTYIRHQHFSSNTVLIHSIHVIKPSQYSLILSIRDLLFYISPIRTSSLLTLSIRDTPTKLLKHFISRTFTLLLSALLIPHASAPYNVVGTITPSY